MDLDNAVQEFVMLANSPGFAGTDPRRARIRAALQAVRDETRRDTLREAMAAVENAQWDAPADAIRALITEPLVERVDPTRGCEGQLDLTDASAHGSISASPLLLGVVLTPLVVLVVAIIAMVVRP